MGSQYIKFGPRNLIIIVVLGTCICMTQFVSAQQPKEIKITQDGFEPSILIVSLNEPVVWLNDDNSTHEVKSGKYGNQDQGNLFQSNLLKEGDRFSYVFGSLGAFEYFDAGTCHKNNHDCFKGLILVK